MALKKPPRLLPNDTIRIISPASPIRPEMLTRGVHVLEKMGFRVHCGEVGKKWRYLAGEDDLRCRELAAALSDSNAKAIFFARGGYGSLRLLTAASLFSDPVDPKILLGSSDITSLHLFFQNVHEWVVFHGPMPSGDISRGQMHEESFRLALMQTSPYHLAPPGVETLRAGDAQGRLLGGCLTLLHSSIGTAWEPDWRDAIIFIEDVGVKPYQIDRMLTHLKILKKFEGVRAFLFGEMKDCIQVENQGYTIQEVLLDLLGEFNVPIYFNFPSGHVRDKNWTLPIGVRAAVSANPDFRLEILEGAVE